MDVVVVPLYRALAKAFPSAEVMLKGVSAHRTVLSFQLVAPIACSICCSTRMACKHHPCSRSCAVLHLHMQLMDNYSFWAVRAGQT
jgi:hypothetical protein